jgi:hypothetical protein
MKMLIIMSLLAVILNDAPPTLSGIVFQDESIRKKIFVRCEGIEQDDEPLYCKIYRNSNSVFKSAAFSPPVVTPYDCSGHTTYFVVIETLITIGNFDSLVDRYYLVTKESENLVFRDISAIGSTGPVVIKIQLPPEIDTLQKLNDQTWIASLELPSVSLVPRVSSAPILRLR